MAQNYKIEVISPLWDNPVIEVKFGTIKELKSKIDAFELLFGRKPKFTFMLINDYYFESAYYDTEYDEMSFGYCYSSMVEGCKFLNITNKYLVFDNERKFRIKPGMVVEIYFY